MAKKTNVGPYLARLPRSGPKKDFLWVLPALDVSHCQKLSLFAISGKKYDPNSIK